MKNDVYEIVTERLIAQLESGAAPWRKPWNATQEMPKNLVSGKSYRGLNFFLLACSGFPSPYFLTYKQAQSLGGNVRKGEKGMPVTYWNIQEKEVDGKVKKSAFLKYYTVFNASQCEGIEIPQAPKENRIKFDPIPDAQRVIQGTGAAINHGGAMAYYRPSLDMIQLPEPETFASVPEYYGTAFHELAHWTGHVSRLNREGITGVAAFGSAVYSREELVAEMASSFIAAKLGLEVDLGNSAAYLQGWIKALRGDSKLAVKAAGAASKAADFILSMERGDG
jgi:antirestriction protein ArdC